jgi:hypothetical protein
MKGRFRQRSTGALWVFAPIAGNWNALGYQKLSHSNINGKLGTEFGDVSKNFFVLTQFLSCLKYNTQETRWLIRPHSVFWRLLLSMTKVKRSPHTKNTI